MCIKFQRFDQFWETSILDLCFFRSNLKILNSWTSNSVDTLDLPYKRCVYIFISTGGHLDCFCLLEFMFSPDKTKPMIGKIGHHLILKAYGTMKRTLCSWRQLEKEGYL